MTFKLFLKYVILPILGLVLLTYAIFFRPINRYIAFNRNFSLFVKYHAMRAGEKYFERLLEMGTEIEDELIQKAGPHSPRGEVRYALYLLGRIQSKKGKHVLLENLANKDATIRIGAIQGLKYVASPDDVKAIQMLRSDPALEIRMEVPKVLAKIDTSESLSTLYDITRNDRDFMVWRQAWIAIRYLEDADGVVAERFRMNKFFQLIPASEPNSEVSYTFFFVKIRGSKGDKVLSVPMNIYRDVRVGDMLKKARSQAEFTIIPAQNVPPGVAAEKKNKPVGATRP